MGWEGVCVEGRRADIPTKVGAHHHLTENPSVKLRFQRECIKHESETVTYAKAIWGQARIVTDAPNLTVRNGCLNRDSWTPIGSPHRYKPLRLALLPVCMS